MGFYGGFQDFLMVVETKAARSWERCSQAKLQGPGVGLIACGKIE
jgi:hypothetical protein